MVKKYVTSWWSDSGGSAGANSTEMMLAKFGGSPFVLTRTGQDSHGRQKCGAFLWVYDKFVETEGQKFLSVPTNLLEICFI